MPDEERTAGGVGWLNEDGPADYFPSNERCGHLAGTEDEKSQGSEGETCGVHGRSLFSKYWRITKASSAGESGIFHPDYCRKFQ
jgi:hypothetical protein